MKSKFKIFGGYGLIIGLFLFLVIVMPIILLQPYIKKENGNLPLGFYIFWLVIIFIFVVYQLCTRVNKIEINGAKLVFTNIITRKKKKIQLNELDGFERKFESSTGGSHELITLKKSNISILKISSFYYLNFNEIKQLIEQKVNEI